MIDLIRKFKSDGRAKSKNKEGNKEGNKDRKYVKGDKCNPCIDRFGSRYLNGPNIPHKCFRYLPNGDLLTYGLNRDWTLFRGECKILRKNKLILRSQWNNEGKLFGKYEIYNPKTGNPVITGNIESGYLELIDNKWKISGTPSANHVLKYSGNRIHQKFSTNEHGLNGQFKSFYKNGNIMSIAEYKDGKLHGKSEKWSIDKKLEWILIYENGITDYICKITGKKVEPEIYLQPNQKLSLKNSRNFVIMNVEDLDKIEKYPIVSKLKRSKSVDIKNNKPKIKKRMEPIIDGPPGGLGW
jgi:antitoxin component YwqK of YwqJK toxin-antitoxin module